MRTIVARKFEREHPYLVFPYLLVSQVRSLLVLGEPGSGGGFPQTPR
jgi:hypothetical protein